MQKRHGLCKNMRGNKKGQVPRTSKKKEKRVRREVKMDKCPEQNQGYKDAHLSGKMDKCPTVELGVSTTHLKKKRREKDSQCSPNAKIKRGGEIAI